MFYNHENKNQTFFHQFFSPFFGALKKIFYWKSLIKIVNVFFLSLIDNTTGKTKNLAFSP